MRRSTVLTGGLVLLASVAVAAVIIFLVTEDEEARLLTCPEELAERAAPARCERNLEFAEVSEQAGFVPLVPASLPASVRVASVARLVMSSTPNGGPGITEVSYNVGTSGGAITILQVQGDIGGIEPVRVEQIGPHSVQILDTGSDPARRSGQFRSGSITVRYSGFVGEGFTDDELRAVIGSMQPLETSD